MADARSGTIPALVAGAIAFVATANYLTVIFAQAEAHGFPMPLPIEVGVWFIAGYAVLGGTLAITSVALRRGRAYALAAATGMIAFIGMLGSVSSLAVTFGWPLLVAAALAGVATGRARRVEGTGRAAAFATALLTYLGGIGGYVATMLLPR